MDLNPEESGLTTRQALAKLICDIKSVLEQTKTTQKTRHSKSWIKDTLHHSSRYTTINWISATYQFWIAISLLLATFLQHDNDLWMVLESSIILILLAVSLALEFHDNRLRHEEVPHKIRTVLEKIESQLNYIHWDVENYTNLFSPLSPCITLQWTYRDGKLVNLPWSLLVKDDVIVIRPGQISPGYCEALDKTSAADNEFPLLHAKEVYAPQLQSANEVFSAPKARKPLESRKYRLLETPYLNNLRIYLEQALDRPITQLNQQRYLMMIKIIERFVVPSVFVFVMITNLIRYYNFLGRNSACHMFLVVPSTAILPLVPLMFPLFWNLVNYVGMARLRTVFEAHRHSETKQTKDSFLEEDNETTKLQQTELFKYTCADIWRNFLQVFCGTGDDILVRSANTLHVLGTVTALGCIDKKGILSWPNPTAEKVFFLHNNDEDFCNTDRRDTAPDVSPTSSLNNFDTLTADGDTNAALLTVEGVEKVTVQGEGEGESSPVTHPDHGSHENSNAAMAEVLDLTHTHSDPFKLHFDDPNWRRHLNSLKPLGLAILLNTCNLTTQERYAAFCSHITCEAIYNENLVPVTNRRCLCELAKEIGFVDQAQKIFALEQQLSTFRHLQPEMVRRDNKYARCLQLSTKLKFPFPHMFAVVVKELSTGAMQLLSEGTADIVLDACADYWDGRDLCVLTPSDRKRIQDFYQRSSLTAYCTAFAYRPLTKCISDKMSEVYLELPSDSRHLYQNHNFRKGSATGTPVHWTDCSKGVLEPKISRNALELFYSTDSLLYNERPPSEVSDAESCFQEQCNQVFIGMVTMQYQALTDMVQLIEQLERACIRFVHFSKENELRSRVFSEKMGLESGWNCHISLLSERNRRDSDLLTAALLVANSNQNNNNKSKLGRGRRLSQSARKLTTATAAAHLHQQNDHSNLESSRAMSFSAPSAINMEHSTVKFADLPQPPRQTAAPSSADHQNQPSEHHSYHDNNDPGSGSGSSSANNRNSSNRNQNFSKRLTSQDSVRSTGFHNNTSPLPLHNPQNNNNVNGNAGEVMLSGSNINASHDWQSLSCLTDSTEQSAPINFDMSNRAKLPRGIDKIRPHIELIDNVPLLVSLFTDCTPSATREMLTIMQDYGEIVCIMGSSANYENAGIFMQADASIAIHPLYPQVCQKLEAYLPPRDLSSPPTKDCCCLSPIDISRDLNSVACSINVKREDPISIYHLIMESRHFCQIFWNSFQFWLACCSVLSVLQLFASWLILPAPFTPGQVLWLCCIVIPALSLSLTVTPVDGDVMKNPRGKCPTGLNVDVCLFVLWCYGLKFLPTIVLVLTIYLGILSGHCQDMCSILSAVKTCTCTAYYLPTAVNRHGTNSTVMGGNDGFIETWPESSWTVLSSRLILSFIVFLHFVIISMGFVFRDHVVFKKMPTKNIHWLVTILVLILCQGVYTIGMFVYLEHRFDTVAKFRIPLWVMLCTVASPIVIFFINELVKHQEITVNRRFQKRARLDFGTKLGMNSPF